MSATSYYATKARAGARTERIGTEMARSSAYIMESTSLATRTSGYTSTLGRQGSVRDTGRSRVRDTSVDCAVRTSRRSSSMDHSAPVKLRTRDLSTDCSSRSYSKPAYTASNRAPRPVTTTYDNDDDHSEEYKKILGKVTDVSLTLSKYAKKDTDALKVESMMEEERRGKAYSKIINQSSTAQIEKDAYRNTMCDIFSDTKSFSAKTMQAINKECLYKEDKGPKNYGWRKDMDSYEENLELVSEHKKALRQSTLATRDAAGPRYKDVNAKMRDYDRECRREVDVSPVRRVTTTVTTPTLDRKSYKAPEPTSSYSNGTSAYSNGTSSSNNGSSYSSNREQEDTTTTSTPKRGSWRKDIEAYEDKLTKPKPTPVINRNVEPKEEAPKVYSWQKKEETKPVEVETPKVYSWQKSSSTTATTSSSTVSTSKYSAKTEEVMAAPVAVKKEEVAETPRWKKPDTVKLEETKPVETKPPPSWKKPELTAKVEETKVESKPIAVTPNQEEVKPSTATSKWNKPEPAHVAEPKAESPKATLKSEEPKPAQISKALPKSAETKKEEPKPETPKATPKWKTPETTAKPAEVKPETPKATPKWKKPEAAAKPAEVKPVEPPKPAPKWGKKAEPAKKPEEPKPEEPKAVPKWKKAGTEAKKEEPKPVEEPKPSPKWKKPETAKKEEQKPAEPEKPAPKWGKKPEAKKEEAKPAEAEKPTPKWKKPTAGKKEEPVVVPVEVEEVKLVVEESRLKPAVEDTPAETKEESKETNKEEAVEKKDGEEEKKEEEEEEDHYGMKAMAKEMHAKQTAMDEEFAQGASKLSALRQKMKAMRAKHKAAADADAAAEAARQG